MQFLIVLLTQWRRAMLARQAAAVRLAVQAMSAEQRKQSDLAVVAPSTWSPTRNRSRTLLPTNCAANSGGSIEK